ncbi:hypothetical protein [Companilactobacillus zhongbaensis]|uniref:hypothetical protein n=1 Tax=Companilactobacillus zhongbaensis TaxID=2486009 RepID=UPI000F77B4D5|nr:hypothetical protein [Companilactobacillus zhongbaensis]
MINLQVSDERTLHQAISAKVNNLQVTDQAFDICKEAIDKTNSAQQRPGDSRQRAFNDLYRRMKFAMSSKNMKKRNKLQDQITSQYTIKEVPNNKAYELIRDTLV